MLCAKARFFLLPGQVFGTEKKEARAMCGFQHHKGEVLVRFLLSDPKLPALTVAKQNLTAGKKMPIGNEDSTNLLPNWVVHAQL